MEELIGLIAAVMSLGIPIVVIICVFVAAIKKGRQEAELKRLIIENNVDTETCRQLLAERQKPHDVGKSYTGLTWGCPLLCVGVALLVMYDRIAASEGMLEVSIAVVLGLGVGLLISFSIRRLLEHKNPQRPADEQD